MHHNTPKGVNQTPIYNIEQCHNINCGRHWSTELTRVVASWIRHIYTKTYNKAHTHWRYPCISSRYRAGFTLAKAYQWSCNKGKKNVRWNRLHSYKYYKPTSHHGSCREDQGWAEIKSNRGRKHQSKEKRMRTMHRRHTRPPKIPMSLQDSWPPMDGKCWMMDVTKRGSAKRARSCWPMPSTLPSTSHSQV